RQRPSGEKAAMCASSFMLGTSMASAPICLRDAVSNKAIVNRPINAGRIGMVKSLVDVDSKSVLICEVRGPFNEVMNALKELEGVANVTVDSRSGDTAVFVITTKDNRDLRGQ